MIYDVTIPMKTRNSQNGAHGHWAIEAKKRQAEKRKVLALVPRLAVTPAVVVTLTRFSSGTMDDDGLRASLKSVRDAIAYRLGVDDRTALVRWEYRQERAKPGEQAVRVQVETWSQAWEAALARVRSIPEPQSGILAVPSHTAEECDDPGCRMHYRKKPKHKRIVILESPYAGRVSVNVEYARAALRDCVLRGEVPLASHLLYTQPGVLRDDVPEERALGINLGLELRRVAEASVVYEDLGVSEGMRLGIKDAEQHGRAVERRSLPGWEGR